MITADFTHALNLLTDVSRRFQDFSPALKRMRNFQLETIQRAFDSGGKNLPERWAPLSQRTIQLKRDRGYSTDILVMTGKMRKSFTGFALSRYDMSIYSVGVPYFEKHQQGIGVKRRAPLQISKEMEINAQNEILRHISGTL